MFDDPAAVFTARLRDKLTGGNVLDTPLTLSVASDVLKSVGMIVKPNTLSLYASHEREPHLEARKLGKMWVVGVDALVTWALAYRDAPKVGVRR